jgi:hypothetical protein
MLEGVSTVLAGATAVSGDGRLLQIVVQATTIIEIEKCPYGLAMICAHVEGIPVVPLIVVRAVGIARARGGTVLVNRGVYDVRFSGQAPAGVGVPYLEIAIEFGDRNVAVRRRLSLGLEVRVEVVIPVNQRCSRYCRARVIGRRY